MSTKKVLTLAGVTLGALMLMGAGCADSKDTTNTNTANTNKTTVTTNTNKANTNANSNTANTNAETADYAVAIVTPEDGDTVEAPFDMEVDIEEFALSDEVEGDNVEGEGHVHLWVDGEYYDYYTESEFEVEGLTAGEHELMVSLNNNDHSDLDPAVTSDPITVTVE